MSTVIPSPARGAATSRPADTEWLRCPGERAALELCMVSNLVILALALAIVLAGPEWLAAHPFLAKHVDAIRAIVLAGVVALPAATFGRHVNIYAARTGAVHVGPNQLPELHDHLVRACRMLGVEPLPELYVSRKIEGPVAAYSVWGGGSVIVLNGELFTKEWKEGIKGLAFLIAAAVGSVRLGHTRWWVELLTVYARRIPGLRTPLLMKETYSRDRCAAFVVPDGVRGLFLEAVGKDVSPNVDISAFVNQTKDVRGFWSFVTAFQRKSPQLALRAHALYDAGLFDRERDLSRARARSLAPPSNG